MRLYDLAREPPEVCQFDLELPSQFTGMDVTQDECMLRGGQSCRFRCLQQAPGDGEAPQARGLAHLPGD